MHDCNPPTEFHQRENYEVDGQFPSWNRHISLNNLLTKVTTTLFKGE